MIVPVVVFMRISPTRHTRILALSSIDHCVILHKRDAPTIVPSRRVRHFHFVLSCSRRTVRIYSSPLTPNRRIQIVGNPLTKLRNRLIAVSNGDGITMELSVLNYTRISVPIKFIREIKGVRTIE